ncbi:ribonuclease domain-containing protein [Streptomyces fructofermentans]|uniref:ribonuclease domain-containing protein n=1 Tax=Streptomyces fructofermentans TaxID=152141 RepID=UPI0034058125
MLLRSVPRLLSGLLLCLVAVLAGCAPTGGGTGPGTDVTAPSWAAGTPTVREADLPREARRTLALIDEGGPFPYARDGSVFRNFEGELPPQEPGHYREFTVRTPGERDRGARRVVTGRDGEVYYTDDHYDSFRAVLR